MIAAETLRSDVIAVPAATLSASVRNAPVSIAPGKAAFSEARTPSTRISHISAILMASEIMRALMSMPDAIPARSTLSDQQSPKALRTIAAASQHSRINNAAKYKGTGKAPPRFARP